ncbi:hypothetical protein BDB01DRAFT_847597 [Pilobolus umbonatus]|nr:hypothetical protein BDB01DRAFT_847597 [Pilobolus umbonatus]
MPFLRILPSLTMNSSPSSPISHSFHPPLWNNYLSKSYTKNYSTKNKAIYLPMCNIKRSGDISMHCLQFRGSLQDNPGFFKFTLAMNDQILMGAIKSNPTARISWIMPNSSEYYHFKGKFSIASAPIQVTRFPPPKLTEMNAVEYWELQRIELWKSLDPKTRATFTWPTTGEIPRSAGVAFSCLSLDTTPSVVHDIAMDNFCLLVYKVTEVEYLDYSCHPPNRLIFNLQKDGQWSVQAANP